MASSIVPGNIDGTFPVAGQDNSSQGFRDNFTASKNNFTNAKSEIETLQTYRASLNASIILKIVFGRNAFRFSGRLIVTRAIPSDFS